MTVSKEEKNKHKINMTQILIYTSKSRTDPLPKRDFRQGQLEPLQASSVRVAVALAVGLLYIHAELVLLIAAHVGVAHEVQRVVMDPQHGRHKVQFHLRHTGNNMKG